jgi:hypothetical protein
VRNLARRGTVLHRRVRKRFLHPQRQKPGRQRDFAHGDGHDLPLLLSEAQQLAAVRQGIALRGNLDGIGPAAPQLGGNLRQIPGHAPEEMRRRKPLRVTQQHVQQFGRAPAGGFNFQVVPCATRPDGLGQMNQLPGNGPAVAAPRLAPPARGDQRRSHLARRHSCQEAADFAVIGQPIQPQFHGAGLAKRLGELPLHGSGVGRRHHGADFVCS